MFANCMFTRTPTWRCLLLVLGAVIGVLVGLLAMHVVDTAAAGHQQMNMAPAAAAHAPLQQTAPTDAGAGTDPAGCATGSCDPIHDMTAMVCTLALLAATILLIAPALGRALLSLGSRAAPTSLARTIARTIGPPPPPSLLALSVDRR
ncbi:MULTISPECIES: DUF6153 family protein [Leifsonia]|uniref:Uncharacterized protein n=2 Tax=Leifsonia aquatica TaxID=144185 RepID=U2RWT4_LEIAQ|nr:MULTISPECIES: DUF6153 family protein [Leifsonia]ERK73231.1 hypothetical protein N136_00423 [Leifsonia aquatica ATCC 14665]MBB2969273.1 hypothetical protein [Leifsonia aquatica]MBN9629749.1 hypothetical protein [Actinomycetota bacterium]MBO1740074.1 hypothetical protein [Leifsonia sp. TF02-11]